MSGDGESKPLLASLVQSGEAQTEAVAINDFIFMAQDISNAYLVRTDDGDVLVNTGFMDNAARTKALLAPARRGKLRTIVLTQAHPDHYGGVPAFLEAGTKIRQNPCAAKTPLCLSFQVINFRFRQVQRG